MAFNFFPRVVKFFDLLEEQNRLLGAAAGALHELFTDFSDRAGKCKRIADRAAEGYDTAREISRQLSLTFITPIDKEDIHELNRAQEQTTGVIHAIATRIGYYGFAELRPGAVELVESLRALVELSGKMIPRLRARQDVAVEVRAAREVKKHCDMHLLVALGELYEMDTRSPEQVMYIVKWAQIFDRIEEGITHADALIRTIEGVGLKNA